MYFEDLTRGTNKEFGPKDFFEIASIYSVQQMSDRYNPFFIEISQR